MKTLSNSQRHSRKQAASDSENRYQLLLNGIKDYAIFLLDRSGRVTSWNKGAQRAKGYTAKEILGQPMQAFYTPEDRSQGKPETLLKKAEEDGRVEDVGWRVRKDGTRFWADVVLTALHDKHHQISGFATVTRDITMEKKREAKFQGLLEAAPDAMIIVDRKGKIASLNAQAQKMFGYTRDELLGSRMENLIPENGNRPHHGYRKAYFKDALGSSGTGIDLSARRKNGTQFPAEISLSPMEAEEGMLVTVVVRDVTERKRQINLLEGMNRQAQEANRLKSEFLANMSHELRTPLNSVIGFAELIHDSKAGPVTVDQKEYLGDILTSAHHLLKLINDILDLAKVESGKIQFRPEKLSLETLAKEVCASLRTMAEGKRIQLTAEVHPDVGWIDADPGRLKQVLYNYISNALKFTSEGGEVKVRGESEGSDFFKVSVEDDGVGIPKEDIGRLFVAFQQLDSSSSKRYPGTGLGLALTKKIVEALGGRVGVDSAVPHGSVFYAVLPRKFHAMEVLT